MEISTVLFGLLIPFVGTTAGAACVFFLRKDLKRSVQRMLNGFAAGVMVAASIWSLIVPAIEQSAAKGRLAFLPAFLGFWIGIAFMLLLDHIIPHLHRAVNQTEGPKSHLARITMMVLAVTLHNIPEGMAVGVVYAGLLSGSGMISAGGALALTLGIAIQNFPEGAIISMPLYAEGKSKGKSFWLGLLSGAVLAFDSCNRRGARMMTKTWLKGAGIRDVNALFSLDDPMTLKGWSKHFAAVTAKSYMRGYRDIYHKMNAFHKLMIRFCDSLVKMVIVKITFGEGKE